MKKISAKAPTRIDLMGGTIDLWPIYQLLDVKSTVNIAVDLFAEVSIEKSGNDNFFIHSVDQNEKVEGKFEQVISNKKLILFTEMLRSIFEEKKSSGLKITSHAKSPAGAGLGGSSAMAIAFAYALSDLIQNQPDEYDLVRFVQDVEARVIHAPTGTQDYWAAVRGGMNIFHYHPGKTIIEKIEDYSNVGFGIVLYTACDVGAKKEDNPNLKDRARQNVVFEHGFLIGKIQRQNVCALVKGEIEKPNDISGVVYLSTSSEWRLDLAKTWCMSRSRVCGSESFWRWTSRGVETRPS